MQLSEIEKVTETLQGYVLVKDIHSRFIWSSDLLAKAWGFKKKEDLQGLSDIDVPLFTDEMVENYIQCDQKAFNMGSWSGLDETVLFDCVSPLLTMKTSLVNAEGKRTALLIVLTPILQKSAFIQELKQQSQDVYGARAQMAITIHGHDNPNNLSLRELEILFFTLRGKSAKAIALILKISHKTIEYHLNNIKLKFDCTSKSQLIDSALTANYMNFVPQSILNKYL